MRIGIVGAGMVYERYQTAARNMPDIDIVAICDRDPARRAIALRGGLRVFATIDAFLEEPLDSIMVLTPNATHRPVVDACLKRGVPILCEKPLALTAAEAEALLASADAQGVLLYVAMHLRHRPEVRYFKEHVDEAIIEFDQTWLEDWSHSPAWYYDPGMSGGGVLLDVGVNQIDWISPHLPSLEARSASTVVNGKVDTLCAIEWQFSGGRGSTWLSWRAKQERRCSDIATASGSRFKLNHNDRSVLHNGQRKGPWKDDEYVGVLTEFIAMSDHQVHRNSREVTKILALIATIYEKLEIQPSVNKLPYKRDVSQ